jgi:hypothetical protein
MSKENSEKIVLSDGTEAHVGDIIDNGGCAYCIVSEPIEAWHLHYANDCADDLHERFEDVLDARLVAHYDRESGKWVKGAPDTEISLAEIAEYFVLQKNDSR